MSTPSIAAAASANGRWIEPARRVAAFSLPIFLGLLLQSLSGAINAMFIGHGLGAAALAATSNANGVLLLVAGVVSGFGIAANIAVGRCAGAGDAAQAQRIAANATALVLGIAVAVMLAGIAASGSIVAALRVPAESRATAATYLALMFAGAPFAYVAAFLGMLLRAHGDARTPFAYLALAVVLDVALNPLLIFGAGPLPALGVAGSALATAGAQAIALIALLHRLRRRGPPAVLVRPRIERGVIGALARHGIALGLQPVVVAAGTLGLLVLVNRHGVDTAAAFGAAAYLWVYLQMPALALGIGITSLAAREAGAGRWPAVAALARGGVLAASGATAVLVALAYLLQRSLLALFLPADGAAFALAVAGNAKAAWAFVVFGASFVLLGVVRAAGSIVVPLLILAIALLAVRLPFAGALDAHWGADAIWWSVPLGLVTAAVLSLGYYRYGRWRGRS